MLNETSRYIDCHHRGNGGCLQPGNPGGYTHANRLAICNGVAQPNAGAYGATECALC
jgi:hypothetical protein